MMQAVVITALSTLVVVLTALLLAKRRSERRMADGLGALLNELTEFLRLNNLDGSVKIVTRKVTDLLEGPLGCEKVVYLGCQECSLYVAYASGVPGLGESDYVQVPCAPELLAKVRGQVTPESIDTLLPLLPPELLERTRAWGCDLWFPVSWREELYGIYLITGGEKTRSLLSTTFISVLAQSLAVARMAADDRATMDRLRQRLEELDTPVTEPSSSSRPTPLGVLKLVRHHDPETLVGKMIDEVQRDLRLERFAFLYESKQENRPLSMYKSGISTPMPPPQREVFRNLVAEMNGHTMKTIADLHRSDGPTSALADELQGAGLAYMISMPLSSTRSAVLAWDDGRAPEMVLERLRQHGQALVELMENAESFERVEELSYTDNLTGLANRRYFVKRLQEEIDRAERYRRSLGLIILDLDQLKGINDYYGHQAGDAVIRRMGEILGNSIRSIDVTARYGGDEFCVIMPESDASTCARFMERLKEKIAESSFVISQLGQDFHCTISQGGAVFPDHGKDSEQLIFAADMALLRAKEGGRNRFMLY
jgi:diguanylate cyclase (GGDEF)-like protein